MKRLALSIALICAVALPTVGSATSAPLATISTGINPPSGVALDSSGKVYVANYGNNTVTVYAANPSGSVTSVPLATIGDGSKGILGFSGVAVH